MFKKIDYKKSGVNIKKSETFVSWIKQTTSFKSFPKGSDFASLFSFPEGYKKPLLASATDGVGTKVKLASYFKEWEGIGQDLVAMCVNDLICTGAKPLFFLDYYACGQLNITSAQAFLKGVNQACDFSSCALVGGETAEMPGVYKNNDFDCAGFAVGVVEEDKVLGLHSVEEGDKIFALSSSGFHSNGYSLLRQIYSSDSDLKTHKKILLEPTRLYTPLLTHFESLRVKAAAHITGGGLDNISRIIPPHLGVNLTPWKIPAPFLEVKKRASLSWNSLLKTLNCGLGFVLILPKQAQFLDSFLPQNTTLIPLGSVISKPSQEMSNWWVDEVKLEALNQV